MATKQRNRLPPVHPGEILQDLLVEAGLTANALATALRVPANRTGGILKGQRGITPDTALRPARYFGASADGVPRPIWSNANPLLLGWNSAPPRAPMRSRAQPPVGASELRGFHIQMAAMAPTDV